MLERPYTLLSCALSLDGYLGSATTPRLELSNDADFDRVDAVRASCDAILVGAATVRNDNPRLCVRSQVRRAEREAHGLPPSPAKVTVTERVELDVRADFFSAGESEKLVYCRSDRVADARTRFGPVATVVDGGKPFTLSIADSSSACVVDAMSSGTLMTCSERRKPIARSRSAPGVRMVITNGWPFNRISSGASVAARSSPTVR